MTQIRMPTSDLRPGMHILIETEPTDIVSDNLLTPTVMPVEVIALGDGYIRLRATHEDLLKLHEKQYFRVYAILNDSVIFFDEAVCNHLSGSSDLLVRIPDMAVRYNRRSSFRIPYTEWVSLSVNAATHTVQTVNLSGGGIAVKIDPSHTLDKHGRYLVDLKVPKRFPLLPAMLSWCSEDKVGFRFLGLSQQQQNDLISYTFEIYRRLRQRLII